MHVHSRLKIVKLKHKTRLKLAIAVRFVVQIIHYMYLGVKFKKQLCLTLILKVCCLTLEVCAVHTTSVQPPGFVVGWTLLLLS